MVRTNITRSACWPCSSNSNWLLLPPPPGPVCLGLFLGYIWAALGVTCEWWGGVIPVTCWHWAYFYVFVERREKRSCAFQSGQIPGPRGCIFHPLWRESKWLVCKCLIQPICVLKSTENLVYKTILDCCNVLKETKASQHALMWAESGCGAGGFGLTLISLMYILSVHHLQCFCLFIMEAKMTSGSTLEMHHFTLL